jgi:hypothetical protein
MSTPEKDSPEVEHQNHSYIGHHVPWYIHVLWICFWIFAISYAIRFLLPVIQGELRSPP